MVVHFPIALIFVVVACDLIGILLKKKQFISAATIVSVFAALGAIAAVISGSIAEDSAGIPRAAHDMFELHETLGWSYLGVIIVLAIFRIAVKDKIDGAMGKIALLIGIIAMAIVSYGGYLGGELVFAHGAGINKAAISAGTSETNTDSQNIDDDEEEAEDDD